MSQETILLSEKLLSELEIIKGKYEAELFNSEDFRLVTAFGLKRNGKNEFMLAYQNDRPDQNHLTQAEYLEDGSIALDVPEDYDSIEDMINTFDFLPESKSPYSVAKNIRLVYLVKALYDFKAAIKKSIEKEIVQSLENNGFIIEEIQDSILSAKNQEVDLVINLNKPFDFEEYEVIEA